MRKELDRFRQLVENKYHIYNGLFMNLPYDRVSNIGMLLPILNADCGKGFERGKQPKEIIDKFFRRHTEFTTEKEKQDFLFRTIQYIERQVVLFDSIEDAAFTELKSSQDDASPEEQLQIAMAGNGKDKVIEKLKDFAVRIVFTAHPTQFYPLSIQSIIHDLRSAIKENNIDQIDLLLHQLGKTSFLNSEKPTPFQEAKNIIYYLRNVYYHAIGNMYTKIVDILGKDAGLDNPGLIELGFWPGGDRDGNPFVTAETTKKVADELRMTLFKCYYNELKGIKRRLTFPNTQDKVNALSDLIYSKMFSPEGLLSYSDIIDPLLEIRQIVVDQHQGFYLEQLDSLITKVKIFKTHFATLDIRQDSSIHDKAMNAIVAQYIDKSVVYTDLSEEEKVELIFANDLDIQADKFEDPVVADTINNIRQLKEIQNRNGEKGCNRYIISNSEDVAAVMNVVALFKWCGWNIDELTFDIIPLFETIKGMAESERVMEYLYTHPFYSEHLKRRNEIQTIMLGFSDGTKDGGYLKANWEIFKTKETLSKVSAAHGNKVVFFDGRGGPPARGGGKSHKFYASQGKNIANNAIQLTIQGQTISSMFGSEPQFIYNCEQMITAGVKNDILESKKTNFSKDIRSIFDELADISYAKYQALKAHDKFIPYLEEMSTLKYYGNAKIGSRPAKRGSKAQLTLSDLRAISFVGSWSQLKQNVPGYFGIGTAINKLESEGRLDEVIQLFNNNAFFKSLILNSMMSLTKTNFALTSYMKESKEYGEFWKVLHDEYELSKRMMLKISGYTELMEEEPMSKLSISVREQMVLPLLTIQQYALQMIKLAPEEMKTYEKMVTRSLFGNINASRNSA